jgi:hypothetical protein
MSQILYTGGYALSTLRSWIACGINIDQFSRASIMRAAFAGYGATGNMAFATNNWVNTRCWDLAANSGSGTVAVTSPWSSGYSTYHSSPQAKAVTANRDVWVNINAIPDSGWSFDYWMRYDPYEIWSYFASTDYYVPTDGWQGTYYIGAVFQYSGGGGGPTCYYFEFNPFDYWGGTACNGSYMSGYASGYGLGDCFQSLDYGGYNTFQQCFTSPGCLVKGTSIEMADGTHKLIEKIRVGDVLKGMKISDAPEDGTTVGWSTDELNLVETSVVVESIIPISITKTYIFNNGLLESSKDHAHFIKRGDIWLFKQAQHIQVGDFLVDKNGNNIEIVSIEIYEHVGATETDPGNSRKVVYDMNVETTDTYIANGMITHNRDEKIM